MSVDDPLVFELFDKLVSLLTKFSGSFTITDRDAITGKPLFEDSKHFQIEQLANTITIKLTYGDESEISIVKVNNNITATYFDSGSIDMETIDAADAISTVIDALPS